MITQNILNNKKCVVLQIKFNRVYLLFKAQTADVVIYKDNEFRKLNTLHHLLSYLK